MDHCTHIHSTVSQESATYSSRITLAPCGLRETRAERQRFRDRGVAAAWGVWTLHRGVAAAWGVWTLHVALPRRRACGPYTVALPWHRACGPYTVALPWRRACGPYTEATCVQTHKAALFERHRVAGGHVDSVHKIPEFEASSFLVLSVYYRMIVLSYDRIIGRRRRPYCRAAGQHR